MPLTLRVDHAARVAFVDVAGALVTEEMIATIDNVVRQLDGRTGYGVLSDHRAVAAPITPAQVAQLLAHLSASGSALIGAKWAVVVSKPASYGMMRLLSARAEELPVHVQAFWDHDEALAWLRGEPSTWDDVA